MSIPFLCVTQSIQISIPYGGLPRKTDKSIIRSLRTQLKYYKYIEFLKAENQRALASQAGSYFPPKQERKNEMVIKSYLFS